jgi:F-type H+-transporting ATPase subunit b
VWVPRLTLAAPNEGREAAKVAHVEAEAGAPREHEVIEFDAATAIWVLIIFVVLLAVLYPTAWKQVLAGLKAREQRIRTDIAEAEAARTRAEATLREYTAQLQTAENKVREMIASAAAEGEKIATGIRAHAQQEAEETKERAMKDIEAAKTQALSEIYEQTAVLATNVAEKILRRNLNPEDQRDLVNRSLEELQSLAATR